MLSPFAEGTLPIISGKIDISRSYAILQGSADEQYIFSLTDKRDNVVFPYGDDIDIVTYSNVWKI